MQSNYVSTHIPEEHQAEATALEYVEVLRIPYQEILNMRFDEFYKITLLHKAVTMRMPYLREDNFYNMNTFGRH